jgi:hypothetical protein
MGHLVLEIKHASRTDNNYLSEIFSLSRDKGTARGCSGIIL